MERRGLGLRWLERRLGSIVRQVKKLLRASVKRPDLAEDAFRVLFLLGMVMLIGPVSISGATTFLIVWALVKSSGTYV